MLHEFLSSNHEELVARCRGLVAKRFAPAEVPANVARCVPQFLRYLTDILRTDPDRVESRPESSSDARRAAAAHGSEMLRDGFGIGDVVHGYGDVCQSVTQLADEQKVPISAAEFHTFNHCLDDAIADAVTSFGATRQIAIDDGDEALQKRLDHFSDEQRRLVDIAIQSYAAIRTGTIGLTGATGTLLVFTLGELRTLADRTLPAIRLT